MSRPTHTLPRIVPDPDTFAGHAGTFVTDLSLPELYLVCAYTARPRTLDFPEGRLTLPHGYTHLQNRFQAHLDYRACTATANLRDHLRHVLVGRPTGKLLSRSAPGTPNQLGCLIGALGAAYSAALLTKDPDLNPYPHMTKGSLTTLTALAAELDTLTDLVDVARDRDANLELLTVLATTWTSGSARDLIDVALTLQSV